MCVESTLVDKLRIFKKKKRKRIIFLFACQLFEEHLGKDSKPFETDLASLSHLRNTEIPFC